MFRVIDRSLNHWLVDAHEARIENGCLCFYRGSFLVLSLQKDAWVSFYEEYNISPVLYQIRKSAPPIYGEKEED